jgi:hypothetical protein
MKNITYKRASVFFAITIFSLISFLIGWILSSYYLYSVVSNIIIHVFNLNPEQSANFFNELMQHIGGILRRAQT